MSLRQSMALGTAGLTAMLSLLELEDQGTPKEGEVLVTGAAGGVGSVAVAILARAGFRPVASTGRPDAHDYLRSLGAVEIVDRAAVAALSDRPLDSARWAGAIDSVGGDTLAAILRTTQPHGTVAACGLAGGHALNTTVMPFILRGVKLIGIDSNYCPSSRRRQAWNRLAADLPPGVLDSMTQVVPLARVLELSPQILQGRVRGRTVVDVNA
jgi:acrylyl-CoA reductase (NADPH)